MPDLSSTVGNAELEGLLDKTTSVDFSEKEFEQHSKEIQRHVRHVSRRSDPGNKILNKATVTCFVLRTLLDLENHKAIKKRLEKGPVL